MATGRPGGGLRETLPRRWVLTEAKGVEATPDALEARDPRRTVRLQDGMRAVRRSLRVCANGEDLTAPDGPRTPVGPNDPFDIRRSIQGG